ncbi:MAG: PTS IIA-like nitrogen regulatory protein PtsN [Thiohalomonadaceae bacterium]|jgi:PTS system nitrogen regulatory IIA component
MLIAELLTAERIALGDRSTSKKRVLEQLSSLIATGQPALNVSEVFDSLNTRERLGSTGLGHGVAIPHGRVKNSTETICAFIKLQQPIDFDAIDGEPVDLLFGLLVPDQSTEEHLQLLAQLAEMFSDTAFVKRLRTAGSVTALHSLLTGWKPSA